MKKMYAFLIIAAAMATSSCNDSKKSETAETAKKPDTAETEKKPETSEKPETACDCIKNMTKVIKDFKKLSVEDISKIADIDAYMNKKMYEGNDCERIGEENDKKYPTPESMEKDCPAVSEFMSIMKDFNPAGNSSQPEAEMPEDF